jgi:hypothetical protein
MPYDSLPPNIKEIIGQYEYDFENSDPYKVCEVLLKHLQSVGYSFEYGLDATPFNFQPFKP